MDCIINPKSGRAVKKSSALGKRLLKNADKTLKEDCLINPKTGRAVKKSSAIGKQILKGMKPIVQSPQNFDDIQEGTPIPPKKKKYSFGSFKTPPKYSKTSSPKPKTPPPPKPPKLFKPKKPRVVKPKITPLPSNLKIPKPKPKPKTPVPEPVPKPKTPEPEPPEIQDIIIPPPPVAQSSVSLVSQDNKRIRTLKQFGGTCWFNALLMTILFSDASRALLLTKYQQWDCDNKIYNTLRDILLNKYVKDKTDIIEYEDFYDIRPENILKELYEYNKDIFELNPDDGQLGYDGYKYVKKLYELLGVKTLFLVEFESNIKDKPIYYIQEQHGTKFTLQEKEKLLGDDYEVILIQQSLNYLTHIGKYKKLKNNILPYNHTITKQLIASKKNPENLKVNKNKLILDAVQVNTKYLSLEKMKKILLSGNLPIGHAVAGLTTRGKKVVYNGWKRVYGLKKNWTNSGKHNIPCEVMPYDWDILKDETFRLGKDCNLTFKENFDPLTDIEVGGAGENMQDLVFSFGESGEKILHYVIETKKPKNIPKAKLNEPPPVPPQKSKAKTIYIQDDSYSLNNYSLDNRIKLYNSAKKYLDKIDEKTCITKVKKGRKSLMTLSGMLFMDTKIGTKSAYGAIYLSSILNVPNLLVVSKITKRTEDNLTELIIMEQLTEKLVKTKKTKHFPLIYTTHICPDVDEVLSVVSVNELCNGDLKMLINNESINDMPDEIVVNIIYQILISLTTFQHFGYLHNDSHWGNFLYQNNKEIGYYEYEYKNQTFFIPSCPYNIMLYDFGLSKEIGDPNDKKCYGDFGKPLTAFQPRHNPTYNGWNESINPRPLNDKIKRIQTKILDYEYFKLSNQDDVFITLLKILDKEFDDMVYKTTLKGNDIILNNTPFIIA